MAPSVGSDPLWYKDAIIYQLHVRAFHDSNGDGIGDFAGLTKKLDYVEELGATAIWVLPFYPSPLRDDGYDIADYNGVNPAYGDLRDFRRFLNEAHRRGIRVISELVMNHTSDQHAWFQRARRAPPGSRWRDFYVWSDTKARYEETRVIFQDFETSNWTWDSVAGAYFWHRFYSHQPDLNFDNPEVHEAMFRVLDAWFEMGVDGMRLDAVPYLYERDGTNCENLPETHGFLQKLRAQVSSKWPDRMLLAEANQWPEDAAQYFGTDEAPECHMNFHFPLMPRLYTSLRLENRLPIVDILEQTPAIPATAQWATFLRNHDELTLEMVTEEERVGMYRAYAQDPQMRVNLGIRRRLAPLLQNDRRKIELLNTLLFSLPGTPVIYYGDEIGMGDNIYLGDRNGVRTPMQWTPDRNAGFSTANPHQLYMPVIIDPEYHYETVNAEAMSTNPSSLLWWMRRMIALRKQHGALSRGSIEFLDPDNHKVLAFLRQGPDPEEQDDHLLVVANLSRHAQCVELDLSRYSGRVPVELFGHTQFARIGELPYYLTLAPYGVYWFQLEPTSPPQTEGQPKVPALDFTTDWKEVLAPRRARQLQGALTRFLSLQRWFSGRDRRVSAVAITDLIPVERDIVIALVRVDYAEGESDTYNIPLGVSAEADAEEWWMANRQHSVVALLRQRGDGDTLVLRDASGDERFARIMLGSVTKRRALTGTSGRVVAERGRNLPELARRPDDLGVRVLRGEQSNSSAIFDDQIVMKLFRKLEPGENPDAEIGRYLTDQAGFVHTAPLLATLTYAGTSSTAERQTLAVFHRFIPNQGDAWEFTLDELGRFHEQALTQGEPDFGALCPGDLLRPGEPPPAIVAMMGGYLQSVHRLGERIAQLHTALAEPTDAAFGPEPFTRLYQRSLFEGFRTQTRASFQALRRQAATLPDDVKPLATELLSRQGDVLNKFESIRKQLIDVSRIRVHGDLHLGQVLYTGQDFVIIDFEGEPARPAAERRIKRSAMSDVAGMLRSFDYATETAMRQTVERGLVQEGSPGEAHLAKWSRLWRAWAQAELLKAYRDCAFGQPFFPDDLDDAEILVSCYVLDKAIYEVRYELGSRPSWVPIPLRGVLNLLDTGGTGLRC